MAKTTKNTTYKSTKRDHLTIILESIRSDFRAFGERLEHVIYQMDTGFSHLDRKMNVLDSNVSGVKKLLHKHDDDLQEHEERILVLENS